jgi:hypothetical protein
MASSGKNILWERHEAWRDLRHKYWTV